MNVPIREAATVLLLRDGTDGIEVFLLRRTAHAVFVPGAYVFPGGAVDAADRDDPLLDALCADRSDAHASAVLGLEAGGLAYWVAAVRECFEEAGVLFARTADGALVDLADAGRAERFEGHRRAVHSGERRLAEVCRDEDLTITLADVFWFSRWVTPEGPPRRFDARFFVAALPTGQEPLHDDVETVASVWMTPAAALAERDAGEMEIILPTARSLEVVGRYSTTARLLDDLRAAEAHDGPVPTVNDITPDESLLGENGTRIRLPIDS